MNARAAFERWYADNYGPLYAGELGYVTDVGYIDHKVNELWRAFSAGWESHV